MSAPATSTLAEARLAHPRALAGLADAWLADGATAFELHLESRCGLGRSSTGPPAARRSWPDDGGLPQS